MAVQKSQTTVNFLPPPIDKKKKHLGPVAKSKTDPKMHGYGKSDAIGTTYILFMLSHNYF